MTVFQYEDLCNYEVSNKPWFGPKKRAKAFLKYRDRVCDPITALNRLKDILSPFMGLIRFVRFIDYEHRYAKPFRYTIALIWTMSNHGLRDKIYSNAKVIVERTGWYPLPLGERIESREEFRRRQFRSDIKRGLYMEPLGKLTALEDAAGLDGGCTIRVRATNGSFLLDAGFPEVIKESSGDGVALISHYHTDHAGGVSTVPGNTQFITSRDTARMLLGLGLLDGTEIGKRVVTVTPGSTYELSKGVTFKPFPVPHCPGATGYIVSDGANTLFYTGDICIRSNRHDFLGELIRYLKDFPKTKNWLLLEATMAGRHYGASAYDIANAVLKELEKRGDIVVVSEDVEQLAYAYLDIFWAAAKNPKYRHKLAFVASPSLKFVFRVLHASFITKETAHIDRYIQKQYGKNMSAWAESRWLFWLSAESSYPEDVPLIWLLSPDDLNSVRWESGVGLACIGRIDPGGVKQKLGKAFELGIDTSPWTLHTCEETLVEAISNVSDLAEVVLFHNYPDRLKRFSKRHGLRCHVLSKSAPVRIG